MEHPVYLNEILINICSKVHLVYLFKSYLSKIAAKYGYFIV